MTISAFARKLVTVFGAFMVTGAVVAAPAYASAADPATTHLTSAATATAAGVPTTDAGDSQSAVQTLLRSFAAQGHPTGGGSLASPEGQQILAALKGQQPATGSPAPATSATPGAQPRAAAANPPCQGTFPSNGAANITVQESPVYGVPWQTLLTPANAPQGTVAFSAQIYADNRQANVYQTHTEPWNYNFHGPLPRTFQVVGGGTYTMPSNASVSFLFYWNSITQSGSGGYAYLNCQYAV